MRIAMVVVVGILAASAPARADHRKFAFGVSMGVGVGIEEDGTDPGMGFAFRIGYRPIPKLAVLWTGDLSLVDIEPEGTTSAHALVAQIDVLEKAFVLVGPAIGFLNPPGDAHVSGPGALLSIGGRVQQYAEYGLRGDVEIELRAHAAYKDGESWSTVLILAGVGF